ncbi:MAG: 6-carboxytetrahydropterin synthase, partial [bacterium]
MNQIRVTKEFRFEAAHALMGYDGPCKNIHGHSYELSVTVIGTPVTDRSSAKLGMVMDFGDLKKIIKKQIVDPFDHALLLNSEVPHRDIEKYG